MVDRLDVKHRRAVECVQSSHKKDVPFHREDMDLGEGGELDPGLVALGGIDPALVAQHRGELVLDAEPANAIAFAPVMAPVSLVVFGQEKIGLST